MPCHASKSDRDRHSCRTPSSPLPFFTFASLPGWGITHLRLLKHTHNLTYLTYCTLPTLGRYMLTEPDVSPWNPVHPLQSPEVTKRGQENPPEQKHPFPSSTMAATTAGWLKHPQKTPPAATAKYHHHRHRQQQSNRARWRGI